MSYRPLPDCLTINQSEIEGVGLFATEDVPCGTEFGISHVKDWRFPDGYCRTPLGGFFNHSENPNCEAYKDFEVVNLRSIKDIKEGEELTANYWLYKV